MSPTTVLWFAIMVAVGSWAIVVALLVVIRKFGQYTDLVLDTHAENKEMQQRNLLIQQENLNLADALAACQKQLHQSPPQERAS